MQLDFEGWIAIAAIVGFAIAEFWYVITGRPTISAKVQALYRARPAIGVVAALIIGWFTGHFFS